MTSSGPVLIEANRYWDPHNEDMGMRRVLRFLGGADQARFIGF